MPRTTRQLNTRELERLLDLLAKLHEESTWDGQLRDAIAFVRQAIWDLLPEDKS